MNKNILGNENDWKWKINLNSLGCEQCITWTEYWKRDIHTDTHTYRQGCLNGTITSWRSLLSSLFYFDPNQKSLDTRNSAFNDLHGFWIKTSFNFIIVMKKVKFNWHHWNLTHSNKVWVLYLPQVVLKMSRKVQINQKISFFYLNICV